MRDDPHYRPLDHLPPGHSWICPDYLTSLVADMFSWEPSKRPDAARVLAVVHAAYDECGQCYVILSITSVPYKLQYLS